MKKAHNESSHTQGTKGAQNMSENQNTTKAAVNETPELELAVRMFEELSDEQKDSLLKILRAFVAAKDEEEEHKRKAHLSDVYGIDIDEMLRIDSAVNSYTVCTEYIFDAWEKKTKLTSPEYNTHRRRYIEHFFFPFLFECGRIYGIRQERKRRHKN